MMLVKRRIASRVWLSTPAPPAFTQGVVSSYDLTPHLRNGGTGLTLSLFANPLQAGVTLDADLKRLLYDGIGSPQTANGVRIAAE